MVPGTSIPRPELLNKAVWLQSDPPGYFRIWAAVQSSDDPWDYLLTVEPWKSNAEPLPAEIAFYDKLISLLVQCDNILIQAYGNGSRVVAAIIPAPSDGQIIA